MLISDELRARVLAYLDDEIDEADRAELRLRLDSEDEASLRRAFGEPIAFGTAGLRAEVGPGPSGMNLRNVVRATRAFLEALELELVDAKTRGIVVAHDARPTSAGFAHAVRSLAIARGFEVAAFLEPAPTPLAAFAANRLGAAGAVVLTASHNPPADNGMKVYGPRGALIVSPWDRAVAARMDDGRATPAVPIVDASVVSVLGDEVRAEHRRRCLELAAPHRERARLRVAYSALHGVGEASVREGLDALGDVEFHSVASQARPDGTFPTTPSPNPEHPAALAAVVALARSTEADVWLATDPDADRLAAGVAHRGELVTLHGDELGVFFGAALLDRSTETDPFVVATIVSSPWLARFARHRSARAVVTLTGHKWIHDRALALEAEGRHFVFGYEEALGFAFPNGVRDKDGVAAAIVFARLAGELRHEGKTVVDELEAIARDVGLHRSRQFTFAIEGGSAAARLESRLARLRDSAPERIADRLVRAMIDGPSSRILRTSGEVEPLGVPASSLFGFELDGGVRALVRASGTEPKAKVYLDLHTSLGGRESYLDARTRADRDLDELIAPLRAILVDDAS